MKKNLTLRILTLTVALLMAVLALASCDAGSSLDSAPNMPPAADNSTADGMEGVLRELSQSSETFRVLGNYKAGE